MFREIAHPPSIVQSNSWQGFGMSSKNTLYKFLRDAMR